PRRSASTASSYVRAVASFDGPQAAEPAARSRQMMSAELRVPGPVRRNLNSIGVPAGIRAELEAYHREAPLELRDQHLAEEDAPEVRDRDAVAVDGGLRVRLARPPDLLDDRRVDQAVAGYE